MKDGEESSILLAQIVAQVIERRQRGERPDIGEYQLRHPELAEEIEGQLRMIEILEGDRDLDDRCAAGAEPGECPSLGEILARHSLIAQKIVFLRNFERRPWKELAEALGRPEQELRAVYSRL